MSYRVVTADGGFFDPPPARTLLTVLNYSGGRQSSALLWMLLRGDVRRPDPFVVLNADPGMENEQTYEYVRMMFDECARAGIEAITVPGPKLVDDLLQIGRNGRTRVDNPPYWTRHPTTGGLGRLPQKCTRQYKIRPMDREIRRQLAARYGISEKSKRIPAASVEKWIGFSADELSRVKAPTQKYLRFAYPLIELRLTNADVLRYFERNKLPVPPRSVCNACFANGLDMLKTMHDERPEDWRTAVRVDEAIRDMSAVGVEREVFVSRTLLPLRRLAQKGFDLEHDEEDGPGWSCDSGYCFT